ncbi:hypothetical protein ACWIID_13295 [Streptomyces phaeochromogenes]
MHRIFQEDPGAFARTFPALDLPFPDPVSVSLMPTDLTEIKPLERRVDTLLKLETASPTYTPGSRGLHRPGNPPDLAQALRHGHGRRGLVTDASA